MRLIAVLFAALLIFPALTAQAVVIPASERLSDIPASAGTGLSGSYYRLPGYVPDVLSAATVAAKLAEPSARFTALTLCFPRCGATTKDGGPIEAYVAMNGTDLTGSANLGASFTRFSGALAIAKAGTYAFSLYSDDGAMLSIGNTVVAAMLKQQPWAGVTTSATFEQPGLYAIQLQQFDIGGYTGITLLQDSAAVPTAALYDTRRLESVTVQLSASVPEPDSLSLLVAGLLGFTTLYRRRG